MQRFLEPWNEVREEIPDMYEAGNAAVHEKMDWALKNYYDLLAYGEVEEGEVSALFPLNGEERLEFIEKRKASHYAFIQLDALYEESQKKAARLSVTYKGI